MLEKIKKILHENTFVDMEILNELDNDTELFLHQKIFCWIISLHIIK